MAHGIPTLETRDWDFKNNVKITGHLDRTPDRYYLEEFFLQRPSTNSDIDQVYTVEVARAANKDWEVNGTNSTTALATFSATEGGITLTTAGAADDQMILTPRLDIAGQNGTTATTAWSGINWGTENQVRFDTAIRTASGVTSQVLMAGLKLTGVFTQQTDADQVVFWYDTDFSHTTWQVVSSIGGTSTTTSTSVSVAASTVYKFRIDIDADRKAACYINGTRVLTTAALTNDVDFIPYVGVHSHNDAKSVSVAYVKMSRLLFE